MSHIYFDLKLTNNLTFLTHTKSYIPLSTCISGEFHTSFIPQMYICTMYLSLKSTYICKLFTPKNSIRTWTYNSPVTKLQNYRNKVRLDKHHVIICTLLSGSECIPLLHTYMQICTSPIYILLTSQLFKHLKQKQQFKQKYSPPLKSPVHPSIFDHSPHKFPPVHAHATMCPLSKNVVITKN